MLPSSSESDSRDLSPQARIRELEQALAAVQRQAALCQAVLDSLPSVIYTTDLDGRLLLVNAAFAAWVGRAKDDIVGKHQAELFPPDIVAYWQSQTVQVVTNKQSLATEEETDTPSGKQTYLSQRSPLVDADGSVYAVAGVATDITPLRQAEREREQLQIQVIDAQQAALRELNTPLIPLAEGVVVMPLIGSIDSTRAEQVLETLLDGVIRYHATSAILDITGLPVVDTQVASVLLQVTRAVRLLGAEVVLTGIGPEVAQTIISLGADLSSITTPGTLQNGIAYALRRHSR